MYQTQINFSAQRPVSDTPLTQEIPQTSLGSSSRSSAPAGLPVEHWPKCVIKTIEEEAIKFATVLCNIRNLNKKINDLEIHKQNGSVPPHLEYKFKHIFKKDDEIGIKTACIEQCINTDIDRLKLKMGTLENTYSTRIRSLQERLGAPLQECNFNLNEDQVAAYLDSSIKDKKLEFILKQNKDEEKKKQKREKFLERKEIQQEPALISTAELTKLKKELESLKSTMKGLKLQSKKAKNEKRTMKKPNSKSKESTGQNKGKGGNRKSTARNK